MAKITKSNIATIRADIEAALKAVAAKHGVDFNLGRISYNDNELRGKLVGIARGATGADETVKVTPEQLALTKYGYLLGSKFDSSKDYQHPTLGTVRVVGYNTRARTMPVIIQQLGSGKRYKCALYTVKAFVA